MLHAYPDVLSLHTLLCSLNKEELFHLFLINRLKANYKFSNAGVSGKVKGSNVSTSIKCNYMKSIKNLFMKIVQRLKRMKLYRTKIGLKIKLSKCRRLLHTFPLRVIHLKNSLIV